MGSHWTPPDDQRGWRAQGSGAKDQGPGEPRRGPPPPGTVPDFSSGSRTFLVITIIVVSVLIVLTGILAAVLFVR